MILEPPDKEGSAVMKMFIGVGVCIALSYIPQTHTEQLPLGCELTSQEVQSIKTLLTQRTYASLKGGLIQNAKSLEPFQPCQSNGYGSVRWSFEVENNEESGTSVLFNDDQHWNPHRRMPRQTGMNRF